MKVKNEIKEMIEEIEKELQKELENDVEQKEEKGMKMMITRVIGEMRVKLIRKIGKKVEMVEKQRKLIRKIGILMCK